MEGMNRREKRAYTRGYKKRATETRRLHDRHDWMWRRVLWNMDPLVEPERHQALFTMLLKNQERWKR